MHRLMRGADFAYAFPDDKWRRLWGVDEADLPELWPCNDDFPKHSPTLARRVGECVGKIGYDCEIPPKVL